jgi:hypothetical protein
MEQLIHALLFFFLRHLCPRKLEIQPNVVFRWWLGVIDPRKNNKDSILRVCCSAVLHGSLMCLHKVRCLKEVKLLMKAG